jgi:hypothetical protein
VAVDVSYTTSTFVGGDLDVVIKITNKGKVKTAPVHFQFGSLKDRADLVGCSPTCSTDEFFGDIFTRFTSGIAPGKTVTYSVRWLATKVGVANWSLSVYVGDSGGSVFFGEGTTSIR